MSIKVYSSSKVIFSYKREVEFEYEGEDFYLIYYWEREVGYQALLLRGADRKAFPKIPDWINEDFMSELDDEADLYEVERDNN